jgi:hypothetical protein
MPRSCRSMCMVAASTSYEAHADPVLAVTAARRRPYGTTDTATMRYGKGGPGSGRAYQPRGRERGVGARVYQPREA